MTAELYRFSPAAQPAPVEPPVFRSPHGLEIERRYEVLHDGWRAAAHEVYTIQQATFAPLAHGLTRLRVVRRDTRIGLAVIDGNNLQRTTLWIPEADLEAFGKEHLQALMDDKGNLQLDDRTRARLRFAKGEFTMAVKAKTDVPYVKRNLEFVVDPFLGEKLKPFCTRPVTKERTVVRHRGFQWDIDRQLGHFDAPLVAEVELAYANQQPIKPDWVGDEVTGKKHFSNPYLAALATAGAHPIHAPI